MQSYSLVTPPDVPGVYALKSISTGELYFGESASLRQRWAEWRAAILGSVPTRSARMRERLRGERLEAWQFIVLREMRGSDHVARHEVETDFVEKARRQGAVVLNTVTYTKAATPTAEPAPQKYKIICADGSILSSGQAANLLGLRKDTLMQRIRHAARTYGTEIPLEYITNVKAGRPKATDYSQE